MKLRQFPPIRSIRRNRCPGGLNRFVWDLRHERPPALRYGYSIAAAYGEDAIKLPQGPLVFPGMYQVRFTANGRTQVAPLEVKLDPRIRVPTLALNQQLALEMKIIDAMSQTFAGAQAVNELRSQLKELQTKLNSEPSADSAECRQCSRSEGGATRRGRTAMASGWRGVGGVAQRRAW